VAAIAGALAAAGLAGVAPAGAQTAAASDAAAVAAAIEQSGWYAEPGASPGSDHLTGLAGWVASNPHPIAYVALAAEPPGSSQSYAYDVLDALPLSSRFQTVVVLSPADIGIDSDYWDDGAIDAALDASTDAVRADRGAGLNLLTADLLNRPPDTPGTVDGDAESLATTGAGPPAGILALVAIGIVALFVISWMVRGEQYERWGDDDEPYWDRRRRYQRYTAWPSRSSGGGSSFRSSSGSSHRSSSSGHSHRGSGGRRL
jgi:hypothetical protein